MTARARRHAQVSMIPVEHQEDMQILHYRNGQEYQPHHDMFSDEMNTKKADGGQRTATVLMYLTTPEEGGETVFPDADRKVTGSEWSECARQGLAVKAVRGNALLFFSLNPDGSEDEASLHGSCPTTRGDKWSATKWIRAGEIGDWDGCALMHAGGVALCRMVAFLAVDGAETVNRQQCRAEGWLGCRDEEEEEEEETDRGGGCVDKDRDCQDWADSGECEANATYMRSYCPRACALC